MMAILGKSDDVKSGRKAKTRHGWLRVAQESISTRMIIFFVFDESKFVLT